MVKRWRKGMDGKRVVVFWNRRTKTSLELRKERQPTGKPYWIATKNQGRGLFTARTKGNIVKKSKVWMKKNK